MSKSPDAFAVSALLSGGACLAAYLAYEPIVREPAGLVGLSNAEIAQNAVEEAVEEVVADLGDAAGRGAAVLVGPAHAQSMMDQPEGAASREGGFGLGRAALEAEIVAWDIDIRPDGMGLPAGSGDVWTGEEVFIDQCASCHGDFGEAVGRWPVLAGGWDTLDREDPVKTIGSYWPYLSTVYDYIYRAMPFGNAQSLSPDEVYAITAYLLYLNNIVEDDFVLSNENFTEVEMPNAGNFFMDDRAETELAMFSEAPCMSDCKEDAEITMRATVLDVTPDDGGADEGMDEQASMDGHSAEGEEMEVAEEEEYAAEEVVTAEERGDPEAEQVVEAQAEAVEQEVAAVDPEMVAAGERAFRQCSSCHQVGPGASNRSGPHLNGVVGRQVAAVEDYRYSNTLAERGEAGDTWTNELLSAFLEDPRGTMRGTKMSFRGVRDADDLAAIIAYLSTQEGE
ncbi:c-type cytochrome [Roseobacter sp. HKCCA0434]|uniref:c-type cytochrome n=1 Tax=Roseobacter sp. HKCCA0434 TaxID=3079297 RepID=UPI002905AEBF|nr:c-type cytochrome [Roseobacter sp. HKCCA0434]